MIDGRSLDTMRAIPHEAYGKTAVAGQDEKLFVSLNKDFRDDELYETLSNETFY